MIEWVKTRGIGASPPLSWNEHNLMARVETIKLIDDVTGEVADETVQFAVDGDGYEIDLADANAKELRSALAGYIESARKLGRVTFGAAPATRRGGGSRAVVDREQNQAIREWARSHGMNVSDRGRIGADVIAAFNAAH